MSVNESGYLSVISRRHQKLAHNFPLVSQGPQSINSLKRLGLGRARKDLGSARLTVKRYPST